MQDLATRIKNDPMDYFKRQSGRTTRMFEAAVAAAKAQSVLPEGKEVLILMKDMHSVDQLREKFKAQIPPNLQIINMKVSMPELNWDELRFTSGPFKGRLLFIDHDVFYGWYKHILKAWTAYDRPIDGEPYLKVDQ
jgi:hypothetical protein